MALTWLQAMYRNCGRDSLHIWDSILIADQSLVARGSEGDTWYHSSLGSLNFFKSPNSLNFPVGVHCD